MNNTFKENFCINNDSSFLLIDFKHPIHGWANRDMTGGYGSGPNDKKNLFFKIFKNLKSSFIRIPSITLATSKSILLLNGYKALTANKFQPGFTHYIVHSSMHHYKYELELAKEIRCKSPKSLILFTGPFSEAKPELFSEHSDQIIKGELETWCDNLRHINSNKDTFQKFSQFPMPAWDPKEIKKSSYFPTLPKKPFLTIQGSRGCPFACEFCPYIVSQGAPLRSKSNERIIEELRYLRNNYKAKSLLFRDITWSFNIQKTKELCHAIINLKKEENIKFDIGVETRLDKLDDDLISLMAAAGVKSVNVGVESSQDAILKDAGRITFDLGKAEKRIRLMEKSGIKVQAFYILGLPDDTVESMENTILFAKFMNTFTAQFCVFTPFPGTATYEKYKNSLITNNFMDFNEYSPVVAIPGATTEEIKSLTAKAYKNYYFRFSYVRKHFISIVNSFIEFFIFSLRK